METPQNPNEALTPYYIGDRIVYIPVTEYYVLDSRPEILLARLAIIETAEDTTNE